MMMDRSGRKAAKMFLDAADMLETGKTVRRSRIAVTGMGSELGERPFIDACINAVSRGFRIYYLGQGVVPDAVNVICEDETDCETEMLRLLASGECDAAVTMHHAFPIGTATVGRVIAPSRGKEMFIATTTGTPSSDRIESLVLGAIYGVIAAKSSGNGNPSIGILNIDGARRAETALRNLCDAGFPLRFAESARADGGVIMRGNDVLLGTADVLVCDPLTGNVLTKMLSAYNSGGYNECSGYGYGPGIGRDARKPVMIVSRASDTPVISNAILYADEVYNGGISEITTAMLTQAEKCGLREILDSIHDRAPERIDSVAPPEREPVTESVTGIEVTDIEDATRLLWKHGIYAESGMGCTGPVVMISANNVVRAAELLSEARYI